MQQAPLLKKIRGQDPFVLFSHGFPLIPVPYHLFTTQIIINHKHQIVNKIIRKRSREKILIFDARIRIFSRERLQKNRVKRSGTYIN